MCNHSPACPETTATDCCSAHVVSDHLGDQGWCRLCNGLILFDDGHVLTPAGQDELVDRRSA